MQNLEEFVAILRSSWHALIPGALERGLVLGLITGVFYCLLVLLIERSCGTSTRNYRSRGFAHDIAYYFYFRSGIQQFLVPAAVFVSLGDFLSPMKLDLLAGLSGPLQFVLWLLLADFAGYWVHRAKHAFRFLWAFHTTHHSQENMTFATYDRVHPVEDILGNVIGVFLLLLLGASPMTSFGIYIVFNVVGRLQHTMIPWRFGPLYWILITPPFHIYHHSTAPEHHDKNFGILFSFWDHLFGTAVKDTSRTPTRFGLDNIKPTSLWQTLVTPFHLISQIWAPGQTGAQQR